MIPSSATPRRRTSQSQRRRPRNAASAFVRGSATACASARALATGLWRLRHAERMMAAGASPAEDAQTQPQKLNKGRSRRRPASHLCYGQNKRRADHPAAVESHCRCRIRSILDKIDACVECPAAFGSSSMEKATKWDANHLHLNDIFFASPSPSTSPLLLLMEAELQKARGQVRELEDERRVMTKRLERFLRKLADEKAAWKARVRDKARHAVAALRDELGAERRHRRQLEQANARLLRDLADAGASAKQQAQSYEMERKARELMEDACSELTREVEEDQAEVELLRRECLRMREEMEEERRMLQMAEVWREERVQMKLSDAKLALENKYTHLNRLQAEMEAFLRTKDDESASHSAALREARLISDAAAAAAAATTSSVVRSRHSGDHHHHHHPVDTVDADSVLDHFRRKERERHHHHAGAENERYSSSPASPASSKSNDMLQSVSPATDLFLAKADDDDDIYADGGSSADLEMDSCSWVDTSDDRSASVANGNGGGSGVMTEARSSGASRRSTKNTALIRRLWRSAITESRKKTGRTGADGGGWSPSAYSADRSRSSVTAEGPPPPPPPAVAGESSGASGLALPPQRGGGGKQKQKQSLKEKPLEARMWSSSPSSSAVMSLSPTVTE